MAILQIKVDNDIKVLAASLYKELGIDLTTAIRIFLRKSIQVGGLPFDVKLDDESTKVLNSYFTLPYEAQDRCINSSKDSVIDLQAIKHDIFLEKMQEKNEANGNVNMTLDEINEEIRLAREERRAREAKEQEANNKNQ